MSEFTQADLEGSATTEGTDAVIVAGDDGEIIDDTDDAGGSDVDGRPDDCECGNFHAESGLPCWPCYRAGFKSVRDG